MLIGTAAITENLLKRKWSAAILRHLDDGLTCPEKIMEREPELSRAALVERLRTMLRYSLIVRHRRYSPSEMAEYRITARGKKILSLLKLIDQLDEPANESAVVEELKLPPIEPQAARISDKKKVAAKSPARTGTTAAARGIRP